MNKVDIKDYIDPSWDVSDIVVEASQELVEKWKPVMNYSSLRCQRTKRIGDSFEERYESAHNYMYHTLDIGRPFHLPEVEEKDYLEVSRQLEYLEQCHLKNSPIEKASQEMKWAIPNFRRELTAIDFTDEEMTKEEIAEVERKITWHVNKITDMKEELTKLEDALARLKNIKNPLENKYKE